MTKLMTILERAQQSPYAFRRNGAQNVVFRGTGSYYAFDL